MHYYEVSLMAKTKERSQARIPDRIMIDGSFLWLKDEVHRKRLSRLSHMVHDEALTKEALEFVAIAVSHYQLLQRTYSQEIIAKKLGHKYIEMLNTLDDYRWSDEQGWRWSFEKSAWEHSVPEHTVQLRLERLRAVLETSFGRMTTTLRWPHLIGQVSQFRSEYDFASSVTPTQANLRLRALLQKVFPGIDEEEQNLAVVRFFDRKGAVAALVARSTKPGVETSQHEQLEQQRMLRPVRAVATAMLGLSLTLTGVIGWNVSKSDERPAIPEKEARVFPTSDEEIPVVEQAGVPIVRPKFKSDQVGERKAPERTWLENYVAQQLKSEVGRQVVYQGELSADLDQAVLNTAVNLTVILNSSQGQGDVLSSFNANSQAFVLPPDVSYEALPAFVVQHPSQAAMFSPAHFSTIQEFVLSALRKPATERSEYQHLVAGHLAQHGHTPHRTSTHLEVDFLQFLFKSTAEREQMEQQLSFVPVSRQSAILP